MQEVVVKVHLLLVAVAWGKFRKLYSLQDTSP